MRDCGPILIFTGYILRFTAFRKGDINGPIINSVLYLNNGNITYYINGKSQLTLYKPIRIQQFLN